MSDTASVLGVCIAGATGWAGRALVAGVLAADDLVLRSGVARSAGGGDLGTALGDTPLGIPVYPSVEAALDAGDAVDVLVDYTAPGAVKAHALAAIGRGVAVVVGTSGLTAADYAEIDAAARSRGVGVIAAGNFSITAAMAQAAALLVAPHLPQAEVIDYASATKPDVPSGTARELAERLGSVRPSVIERPVSGLTGPHETRGAAIEGVQVHSIRLPGFTLSTEVVFGLPDERLSIRHDAGGSAAPYVAGTLLAVRRVVGRTGLTRGLDTLLLEGGTRATPGSIGMPIIYGVDTCEDTTHARERFDAAGARYRYVNLDLEPAERERLHARDLRATPVIVMPDGRLEMEPSDEVLAELIAASV